MTERVFFEVADIADPTAAQPFAIIAIYPDRPKDGGCVAIVLALHVDRDVASAACQALAKDTMQ